MIKRFSSAIFAVLFSGAIFAAESVISVESSYTVKETADRFEKILEKKGLTIFARIDHSKNASNINLELAPTEVVIFGNPKIGTPLMRCSKTVAIDLPQKALFWQDAKGQVWLSYNNPEYLKERHSIKDCDKVIDKVASVLAKLSKAAISKP